MACTILGSGGKQVFIIKKALLKILSHTKNPKIKQSIISILSRRVEDFEIVKCDIKITNNDV